MPYVHYKHTRTRDRPSTYKPTYKDYDLTSNFSSEDPYYSSSLVRYTSDKDKELALYEPPTTTTDYYKPTYRRTYSDEYTDDGSIDDYPWPKSSPKYKSSSKEKSRPGGLNRSLTIRRSPTKLEKYNIWSHPSKSSSSDSDSLTTKYKFKSSFTADDDPLFDISAKVKIRRSKKEEERDEGRVVEWPTEVVRREKWERVDWEARERDGERDERYRRIGRRTTDEWRPLSGFRHNYW